MESENKRPQLDQFESSVLAEYNRLKELYPDKTPGNREMAKALEVSRNAVGRARKRIAHKLGFRAGW